MFIKKYKKELNDIKKEIESQKILLNMTKTCCCDMCMSDYLYHRNEIKCSNDLNQAEHLPVIRIEMGYRIIGLCKKHMKDLGNYLLEEAEKIETNDGPSKIKKY